MMENEARHIPHPSVPLPCQPNGRCDGAGPPVTSSLPRLALVCWTTRAVRFTFACHVCCFAGPMAMHSRRGGAKRTKVSDHYAGHAQRAAVVMAQADQASEPTRSTERQSDDAAAAGSVDAAWGAASDGASGVHGAGCAPSRKARASEGNGGPREELVRRA